MLSAELIKSQKIVLIEKPVPEPGFGEVRVKLIQVGVCGSDVHFFMGHRLLDKPTTIGHEGVGIINKVGQGVDVSRIGQRVVIEPNIPCGKCLQCQQGRGYICTNKRIIGLSEPGCFAQFVIVPESFAWSVSEAVSNDDASAIEPLAVAYHALFTSGAKPGDCIAVIGLGAIGLLLARLAVRLGYGVFVTEMNPEKIEFAASFGALPTGFSSDYETQVKELSDVWTANEVCAVFECAGSAVTASLVAASAPRGSEIVLVGLSEKQANFQPLKIAREGISILPSIIYHHPFDFKRAIRLVEQGVIHPGEIISKRFSLHKIQQAMEVASTGVETKVLIEIPD